MLTARHVKAALLSTHYYQLTQHLQNILSTTRIGSQGDDHLAKQMSKQCKRIRGNSVITNWSTSFSWIPKFLIFRDIVLTPTLSPGLVLPSTVASMRQSADILLRKRVSYTLAAVRTQANIKKESAIVCPLIYLGDWSEELWVVNTFNRHNGTENKPGVYAKVATNPLKISNIQFPTE